MSSRSRARGPRRRRDVVVHVITDENLWMYVRETTAVDQLCDLRGPQSMSPQLVVSTLPRSSGRWLWGDVMLVAVSRMSGEVRGALRLSSSLGPLARYQHLSVFGASAIERSPFGPIWDGFDVVDLRQETEAFSSVTGALLTGLQSYAIKSDIEQLTAVVNVVALPQLLELGWSSVPLGLPREVRGIAAVAVQFDVSEYALKRTRAMLSIAGPTLIRRGLSRRLQSAIATPQLLC